MFTLMVDEIFCNHEKNKESGKVDRHQTTKNGDEFWKKDFEERQNQGRKVWNSLWVLHESEERSERVNSLRK